MEAMRLNCDGCGKDGVTVHYMQVDKELGPKALHLCEECGQKEELVKGMGFVSDVDIAAQLVKRCRVPHIRLEELAIPEAAIQAVPQELACKLRVMPVDKAGEVLSVAMLDPRDLEVIDALREATGLEIRPFICQWSDLEVAWREGYQG